MKEIKKIVYSWRKSDKYECPECGKKLSYPDYECKECDIKLKLKVKF